MKNTKKNLMHVLGITFLFSMTTLSQAEIVVNNVSQSSGQINSNWSSADVDMLLNGDVSNAEASPQGSVTVKTTVRNGSTTSATSNNIKPIVDTSGFNSSPNVNARAALVMDAQTGEVLYSKNSNSALPIASITKLMTAVVIADARLNMSENITLQQADFSCAGCKSSSSTLRAGDTMNRAEALLFALMKSENPAASALARTYPGGRAAFIAAMNTKAKQLGMTNTHYMESTGLHPGNVASARDLGILVSAASQYGLIRQFSTTPTYDFNLGYRVLKSNNTNALVRNGGWNINISKTGFINEAGRCVVMHTTLNKRPAVVVILGAPTTQARNDSAVNLMTWTSQLPQKL